MPKKESNRGLIPPKNLREPADRSIESGSRFKDELEEDLTKRQKGWVYGGKAVKERKRKKRDRKPQVSRYTRVRKRLQEDMFNSNWVYRDSSQIEIDVPIDYLAWLRRKGFVTKEHYPTLAKHLRQKESSILEYEALRLEEKHDWAVDHYDFCD